MTTSAKTAVVSTSWDDGHCADLRLAEMLCAHGLAGTFYIPIEPYRAGSELTAADIRQLASSFEIGGHTVSHRSLTDLTDQEQEREVSQCKLIMEDRLASKVESFCYPNGRLNRASLRAVEQAGYQGARTTRMLGRSLRFNRFEMPTTLQAYPHTPQAYVRNTLKGQNLAALTDYVLNLRGAANWVELGKMLFDHVLEHGGFWHLYGHSWELDDLNLWPQLEELLSYVAQAPGVQYLSNGAVHRMRLQEGGTAS